MKRPKKIKILGKTYKVKYCKKIENENIVGDVNSLKRLIRIKEGNDEIMESALLHEILHAILMELGFEEENKNEHLVCSLETGLYQVLKENSIWIS